MFLLLNIGMHAQSVHHFNARPAPEWFREGLSYQLMLRSFTEEGTLKSAEKHLERLGEGWDDRDSCGQDSKDQGLDEDEERAEGTELWRHRMDGQ